MPRSLSDRLLDGVVTRARGLGDRVARELAEDDALSSGALHALGLFQEYARTVESEVLSSFSAAADPALRLAAVRTWMEHLQVRIELFDQLISRQRSGLPSALAWVLEQECARLGLGVQQALVTVGEPGNFSTYVVSIDDYLFRFITRSVAATPQPLLVICVPELEGSRASWQPVVAGHELAHYVQVHKPVADKIDLRSALDNAKLEATTGDLPYDVTSTGSRSRALTQVAVRWLNELICDAFAVHMYGPAGLAAMVEFLEAIGAAELESGSHPPASLRTALMFKWIGGNLDAVESEVVEPYRELASETTGATWVAYLAGVMLSLADDVLAEVSLWSAHSSFRDLNRSQVVAALSDALSEGIPAISLSEPFNDETVTPADLYNACWLAETRRSPVDVNRLTLKALATLSFLDGWVASGGEPAEPDTTTVIDGSKFGALTAQGLLERLSAPAPQRIVITPRLPPPPSAASIDVRVGNTFIVFQRTSAGSFDALDDRRDPRTIQRRVEKAWGDVFFLHPGELVLAATLEYICVPGDLTAQVITRSSYGRLGLLSATAVQVHPHFRGCLTLELVNLGAMPMAITPGERIAQLMFFGTSHVAPVPLPGTEKYRFPTGPEFSHVRADGELATLQRMREAHRARRGQ